MRRGGGRRRRRARSRGGGGERGEARARCGGGRSGGLRRRGRQRRSGAGALRCGGGRARVPARGERGRRGRGAGALLSRLVRAAAAGRAGAVERRGPRRAARRAAPLRLLPGPPRPAARPRVLLLAQGLRAPRLQERGARAPVGGGVRAHGGAPGGAARVLRPWPRTPAGRGVPHGALRRRLPPRWPAPGPQGARRAHVHGGPHQAPVHDGDLRPRDQHARALGRLQPAPEVRRYLDGLAPDPRLHADGRSCRAPTAASGR